MVSPGAARTPSHHQGILFIVGGIYASGEQVDFVGLAHQGKCGHHHGARDEEQDDEGAHGARREHVVASGSSRVGPALKLVLKRASAGYCRRRRRARVAHYLS